MTTAEKLAAIEERIKLQPQRAEMWEALAAKLREQLEAEGS
jgi:hypothetical protein